MMTDLSIGNHQAPGVSGGSRAAGLAQKAIIASLAALAQEARLRIFLSLVEAGPAGVTPGALSARLALPSPTLSFHLTKLMHAGLVSQTRESRNLIYRPAMGQMEELLSYLGAHCRQRTPGDLIARDGDRVSCRATPDGVERSAR